MARVNHEQFMVGLLAHVASKPNHGKRELLDTIIALQAQAMVPDDTYRAVLDRFGEEVAEAVLGLLPTRPDLPTDSPGDELADATHEAGHPSIAQEGTKENTAWTSPRSAIALTA